VAPCAAKGARACCGFVSVTEQPIVALERAGHRTFELAHQSKMP
jgi:hypothetical protein